MKRSTLRGRILRERHEHLRDRFALQPLPPHVGHHAHDRVPRAVGIPRAQLEPSAHWIVPRPRAPSHRIVDDRDRRSIGPIPDRKEAAAEQRRSEGLKKSALTSSLVNRRRSETVPSSRSTVRTCSLVVTNEQIADDAGALHTRNRLNLFEHAVVTGRSVARGR